MDQQQQPTLDDIVRVVPETPASTGLLLRLQQVISSPTLFNNLRVAELEAFNTGLTAAINGAVQSGLAILQQQREAEAKKEQPPDENQEPRSEDAAASN